MMDKLYVGEEVLRRLRHDFNDENNKFGFLLIFINSMDNVKQNAVLDLCNKEELRKFILDCLTQEEEKSRTQHNHADIKDMLPLLVDQIVDFLLPQMPLPNTGMELPFYQEVNLIILNAIKPRGGTAFASNSWAGSLLNSILNS